MPTISLERERARLAWDQVSALGSGTDLLKKYRSQVRGFPAMVQSIGIGQAAAFLGSKVNDSECQLLLDHITAWAFHERRPIPWRSEVAASGDSRLIRQLKAEEPEVWWVADREIIAYAVWLKRLAESLAG